MKKMIILLGFLLLSSTRAYAGPVTLTVDFLNGSNYEVPGNITLSGNFDFTGDYPVLLDVYGGHIQIGEQNYSFNTTQFSYNVLQGQDWQNGYSMLSLAGDFTDSYGVNRSTWGNFEGYVSRFLDVGELNSEGLLKFDGEEHFMPARLKVVDVYEPASLPLCLLGFAVLYLKMRRRHN